MMEKYFWISLLFVSIVQLGKIIKLIPVMFNKLFTWLYPLLLIQLFIVNIFCFLNLDSNFIDIFMILQFVFYSFAILGIFSEFKGVLGRIISIPTSFLIVNGTNLLAVYYALSTRLNTSQET